VCVCQDFFLKTLSVGTRVVETAFRQIERNPTAPTDMCGKHSPHNKTSQAKKQAVRNHIESFPVLEPHYTRRNTARKFLGEHLSQKEMYRLYREECAGTGMAPVGEQIYRMIFSEDYNLSFHVPKKDQCQTCEVHEQKSKSGSVSEEDKRQYDEHIRLKDRARQEKESNKLFDKDNQNAHMATFDIEKVLTTPTDM